MDEKYLNYYLLYKLNSCPTLWIVNVYESIDNKLVRHVKNFLSKHEKYYLVAKVENYENNYYANNNTYQSFYDDKIIKQFTVFNIDDSCELICRSS